MAVTPAEVSAVGGMTSALVATITYVTTTVLRRNTALREKADTIRESVREIDRSTKYQVRELVTGYALLSAAASVTEELRSRIADDVSGRDLKEVMEDGSLMLSVAVAGWYKNGSATALTERMHALRHVADGLSGSLRFYQEILDVLSNLVDDGYSPMIFKNSLDLLSYADVIPVDWNQPSYRFFIMVNDELQSKSAEYFLLRYAKALEEIEKLIEYFSNHLLGLDDATLLEASKARQEGFTKAATHTGSLKTLTRGMSHLSKDEQNNILASIENLETYISKQHASEEMKVWG